MKLKTAKIVFLIISSVIILITFIIISLTIPKTNSNNDTHKYVEGIVIEKNIIEGYAGYYNYYPTEYQIVAEYKIDGEEYIYTHYVSSEIYNSYEINSKIKMCVNHKKIIDYE